MSRFAILTHDHPFLHWDLLLENDGWCRTWRMLTDPAVEKDEILAEQIADHRLMYLDYEGPVSGNRGNVTRWDYGEIEWRVNATDECEVVVRGTRWRGTISLKQIDEAKWVGRWLGRDA
jgi:hypothetical protein